MTGTVDSATTELMRSALPRGISTSTNPRARMSCFAPSRPNSSIVCTDSAGSPAEVKAPWITSTSTRLVFSAAVPPRRTAALPLLSARAAMSIVTLGRAS